MSSVDITPKAVERMADKFQKGAADNCFRTNREYRQAAATLRAQAERIAELEAELARHRADRPFVIGWNDGFAHGVKEAADARGMWFQFNSQGEPNGGYCTVETHDPGDMHKYVNRAAILALITDEEQTPPSAAQAVAS